MIQNSGDPEQREAWSFFLQNAEVLYEAKVAYTYALFALNEVYRQMGIQHYDIYRQGLTNIHQHFERLLGAEGAESIRERSDVLQFFQKCQDRQEAEDLFHNAFHVVRHFNDGVRVPFQLSVTNRKAAFLDPRLQQELPRFLDDLSSRSLEMLLDGYISQFLVQTQKTLIFLLQRMGARGTHPREWLERELASLSRAPAKTFALCWAQIRDRKLAVGPVGTPLIAYMRNKYHERLSVVIRVLRPQMKSDERRMWRKHWLNKWTTQLGMRPESDSK